MKAKIRLETLSDVQKFVSIATKFNFSVNLTDGDGFTVSAKSLLGALYSMEWKNIYCECEKDIYREIEKFIVV